MTGKAEQIYLDLNMEMTGHCTILGEKTYNISGLGLYFGQAEAGLIQWDQEAFSKAMQNRRRR